MLKINDTYDRLTVPDDYNVDELINLGGASSHSDMCH